MGWVDTVKRDENGAEMADFDIELDGQVADELDTGWEGMPRPEVCAPGFGPTIYPKAHFLEQFIVKGRRRCWHSVRAECNVATLFTTSTDVNYK